MQLTGEEWQMGWTLAEPTDERVAVVNRVLKFYAERPDIDHAVCRFIRGSMFSTDVVVHVYLVTSAYYEGQKYGQEVRAHPSMFTADDSEKQILDTFARQLYTEFHEHILREYTEKRRLEAKAGPIEANRGKRPGQMRRGEIM